MNRAQFTTFRIAAFERNDAMLATLPIGGLIFPGSAVHDNLGDKACFLGFPYGDP